VELGPDATLTALVREALPDAVAVPLLRRDRDEPATALTALGQVHVQGHAVDWNALFTGEQPPRVDLPTYPFQRRRYWLEPAGRPADAAGLGLGTVDHPFLGAAVVLPDGEGVLLTGSLSLRSHPWLADHAVQGTVVVPGTALLELAIRAGEEVSAGLLDELVVEAPLLLPAQGGIHLQVAVGSPDPTGARPVTLHSRPAQHAAEGGEEGKDGADWTRHASGLLAAPVEPARPPFAPTTWPPPGAEPLAVDGVYGTLSAAGLDYGPAFRGLRAAWRDGEDFYAEVALPEDRREQAARFGLHPALLDAAVHLTAHHNLAGTPEGSSLLPFAYEGVQVHATGAVELRVRLRHTDADTISVEAADATGAPVASVAALRARQVTAAQLASAQAATAHAALRDELFRLDWTPLPLPAHSPLPSVPWTELLVEEHSAADVPEAARAVLLSTLTAVQAHLADPDPQSARLVVVTRGAVAAAAEERPAPASAPLWGLLRSAQAEHPDRLLLVDLDDDPDSEAALPAAVAAAIAAGEPQLALRIGEARVPRLARTAAPTGAAPVSWNPDGTVLITGGSGVLAGVLARHLVATRGARRLLLLSRRGAEAPGAEQLRAELTALGAEVAFAAADTADREALAAVLAAIPAEHPLTAVVHTAGVVDDGVIGSLTPERLDTVLRPKLDGAWNLHRLTLDQPQLAAFVLYSSVAAVFGGPGQSAYAAANTFLDALAVHRRANGLPGQSLAWGQWAEVSGVTAQLGEADLRRAARAGVRPISSARGVELFDAAALVGDAYLVPAPLALNALRGTAVHPLLRGLVRPARRSARAAVAEGPSLAQRLSGLDGEGREAALLELVRTGVAAVLGAEPDSVLAQRPFNELGLDSLTAVELRNRLTAATGLRLPPTVTFDHPTPAELTTHIARLLTDLPTVAPSSPAPSSAPATASGAADPLSQLYRRLAAQGKFAEASALIGVASHLRPRFATAERAVHALPPIRLASGDAQAALVCFPALSAISGPHEYARFGHDFQGERDVFVLPSPGWKEDDHLPQDLDAFLRLHTEAVLELVGPDRPIVVVGRSMGGCVAHAVTARLERQGRPVAGLALIDAYPIDSAVREGMGEWWLNAMLTGMLDRIERYDMVWSDASLTAMGGYNNVFATWQPEPVDAPILSVRADTPLRGTVVDPTARHDWRAYWPLPHEAVDVTGDHFTLLEQHTPTTAHAVRQWIEKKEQQWSAQSAR